MKQMSYLYNAALSDLQIAEKELALMRNGYDVGYEKMCFHLKRCLERMLKHLIEHVCNVGVPSTENVMTLERACKEALPENFENRRYLLQLLEEIDERANVYNFWGQKHDAGDSFGENMKNVEFAWNLCHAIGQCIAVSEA